MRIAVCDDEAQDLQEIRCALRAFDPNDTMEVCAFERADDFYKAYKLRKFDIAILDIEMSSPNGFDIGKKLVEEGNAPIIIFLTKSMEYCIRGYGIAFRYLTKPIEQDSFHEALSAAVTEASAKNFLFSADGTSHIVRMEDIFYFEVLNHHTTLYTMDQNFTFRATLKEIVPELPVGYFGTPHTSYIVNLSHVRTATPQEVHLTNGMVVPISRRKQKEFERQLLAYLGR